MLNDMPYEFKGIFKNFQLINFFGFIKAEITCSNSVNRPVLPLKYNGKTIYPKGRWIGTYFSEELKAVEKLGYIIKPLEGYAFSKFKPFTDYINHFYLQKKNSKGPERFISKMHLNQFYG